MPAESSVSSRRRGSQEVSAPTSIPSRLELRVGNDFIADLVEVVELLARAVQLLSGVKSRVSEMQPLSVAKSPTYKLGPLVRVASLVAGRL